MRFWSHKILVFTDVHLTQGDKPIIGLSPSQRFEALLDQALKRHPDADAIYILGDLAHHGHNDAYQRLKTFLQRAETPVIPMLGNHDNRENFSAVFPDADRIEDGFIQSSRQFGDWQIITLDTLDAPPYPNGRHSGFVCKTRLEWLSRELEKAKERQVIVCTHHPPFLTGIAGMDMIPLTNRDEVMSVLKTHAHVQLLCGHVHRTICGVADGIPWTIFKGPCHQGYLDFENADSSISIDEPGAYGIILLSQNGTIIHHEDMAYGNDVIINYDPASQ